MALLRYRLTSIHRFPIKNPKPQQTDQNYNIAWSQKGWQNKIYRILILLGDRSDLLSALPLLFFALGNTFQNRSVSSPAPVTIVSPLGDIAK
ncbi:unnamed protein product [Chondrus crispus]|uniref:Uncharacterized protein n=1 Tax=Chondrus crispus TaxID=2769 RepID=R7QMI3_CHOCR|nr:unnamed protein product [Chondrus crispus]CDF39722.1 unnamed protein product [Chondrus crispus]|eukprot:XP_005710016.1 unnamed protein product [Chondrus crispus]